MSDALPATDRSPPPSLPRRQLAQRQADWLRGARSRLLRRAGVAQRRMIVDLGAGWGCVTDELLRRCAGTVIAVDCCHQALVALRADHADAHPPATTRLQPVRARVQRLPIRSGSADLIFSQCVLLWAGDLSLVLSEVARVLAPGGFFAAIEPDYGGLMEYPPALALQAVWCDALRRCGADPLVGRKLPGLVSQAGLDVEVRMLDRAEPPDPASLDLLAELPLTADERARVKQVRQLLAQGQVQPVVHLPFWLVLGAKPY